MDKNGKYRSSTRIRCELFEIFQSNLYVLYEHASGYSLFRVREFEEIGMSLPQVEASVVDLSNFATVVKLVAFHPFQSGINALDNINAISEGNSTFFFCRQPRCHVFRSGLVHDDLRAFLDTNLPKEKKRAKMVLGVADSRIASAINESFSITCQHTGVVPELIRGSLLNSIECSFLSLSLTLVSFFQVFVCIFRIWSKV